MRFDDLSPDLSWGGSTATISTPSRPVSISARTTSPTPTPAGTRSAATTPFGCLAPAARQVSSPSPVRLVSSISIRRGMRRSRYRFRRTGCDAARRDVVGSARAARRDVARLVSASHGSPGGHRLFAARAVVFAPPSPCLRAARANVSRSVVSSTTLRQRHHPASVTPPCFSDRTWPGSAHATPAAPPAQRRGPRTRSPGWPSPARAPCRR